MEIVNSLILRRSVYQLSVGMFEAVGRAPRLIDRLSLGQGEGEGEGRIQRTVNRPNPSPSSSPLARGEARKNASSLRSASPLSDDTAKMISVSYFKMDGISLLSHLSRVADLEA